MQLKYDEENIRNKASNEDMAYTVVDDVIIFWQMARIKTKTRQNCMLDVIRLFKEWKSLIKNKNRDSDPEREKRAMFTAKLDGLFDIGATDAIETIMNCRLLSAKEKKADVDFYLDQKAERAATMCGHDKVFEVKAKYVIKRQDCERKKLDKERTRKLQT